jgi:integrase
MTQILKTAALPEIDARVRTFILTMRYSGLRISDTTALACEGLKGDRLQLHQAKTGEYVFVLLPTFVADALRKVVHRNPAYFFWTGTSKLPAAVSVWRKRLADVFKKAKIKNGHSHRFRDTFAVSLLQAGVSLEDVSTLLGHKSLRITQKHYSPWVKTRQDALDKAIAVAIAHTAKTRNPCENRCTISVQFPKASREHSLSLAFCVIFMEARVGIEPFGGIDNPQVVEK